MEIDKNILEELLEVLYPSTLYNADIDHSILELKIESSYNHVLYKITTASFKEFAIPSYIYKLYITRLIDIDMITELDERARLRGIRSVRHIIEGMNAWFGKLEYTKEAQLWLRLN